MIPADLTTSELKDLSLMWLILSGDARQRNDNDTSSEFWDYAQDYHNRSLSSPFFAKEW